jgi:hypothetical protein
MMPLQPHQGVVRSLAAFGRSWDWVNQITVRCEDWDTDIGPVEVRNWVETKMQRSVIKATFLATAIISMSGWLWLLAVGIRWLNVKL